jgi:hypothetical protein
VSTASRSGLVHFRKLDPHDLELLLAEREAQRQRIVRSVEDVPVDVDGLVSLAEAALDVPGGQGHGNVVHDQPERPGLWLRKLQVAGGGQIAFRGALVMGSRHHSENGGHHACDAPCVPVERD